MALARARQLTDSIMEFVNNGTAEENKVNIFPYSVFYVFYEQYLTMWRDTLQSLAISLFELKLLQGIVQIHSIICLSSKFLLIKELNNILTMINPTNVIIKTRIILIKSCKKINSSIIGEFASCKPN